MQTRIHHKPPDQEQGRGQLLFNWTAGSRHSRDLPKLLSAPAPMEEGYTEPTLDSLGGASLYIPSFTPRRALFHLMMDSLSSSMPWTHPRTEQPCLCPLGPQGPHSPPHVPGGCYGPSPQVRKPQGPGRRGQAGSGQASLVPEAWSWHLTVWGA